MHGVRVWLCASFLVSVGGRLSSLEEQGNDVHRAEEERRESGIPLGKT